MQYRKTKHKTQNEDCVPTKNYFNVEYYKCSRILNVECDFGKYLSPLI